MAATWGRNETIITPPTVPIYTFSALRFGVLCLFLFVWQRAALSFACHAAHLPRGTYVRSSVGALAHQTGEYRLIFLDGPRKAQPPPSFAGGLSGQRRPVMPNGEGPARPTYRPATAQGFKWFRARGPSEVQ